MRFSAAMTLFGMQQMQNAVGAAADTQAAVSKFREALAAFERERSSDQVVTLILYPCLLFLFLCLFRQP